MVIQMLVANGALLTLHAQSLHFQGLAKRITDLRDRVEEVEATRLRNRATVADGDRIAFEACDIVPCRENERESGRQPPNGQLQCTQFLSTKSGNYTMQDGHVNTRNHVAYEF